MPSSRALVACLALFLAGPAAAEQKTHDWHLGLEGAADLNPRRAHDGPLVYPDSLTWLVLSGQDRRALGDGSLSSELELGGKRFNGVHAEDVLAGRLDLQWTRPLSDHLALIVSGGYTDIYQRGDPADEVAGDALLSCTVPEGRTAERYRCNTRDFRRGLVRAALHTWLGEVTSLRFEAIGTAFQYKPNPAFTFAGPGGRITAGFRVNRRWQLGGFGQSELRIHHPSSTVFTPAFETPRREWALTAGSQVSYRGPFVLTATAAVVRTFNNGPRLDVVRLRGDLVGAIPLGEKTTLVASGTLQLARFPDGNLFRGARIGEDDERQNAVALKLSHRVTERLTAVGKVHLYANELSSNVRRFRRLVAQVGLRVGL